MLQSGHLINNIINYSTVIQTEDALNIILMMEIDETSECVYCFQSLSPSPA